ncbi:hypothetical protein HLRTI_002903 [Halorhabdus tiamatea SARL4B]|uniref:Uncharacterized protein n=1 Tax=Halorhabdus tiamatea SARL4B TaxID=1033806 RepID=U2F9C4_9EURY|nr:hypothetical protein [Halorhabdus tiamatea]ERJ05104.1 hypothetical protein HLRTI_002903 [Halorhabdus tiamatea SARL4B]
MAEYNVWTDIEQRGLWSLKVNPEKEIVLAIREVPFEGQIFFSTEYQPNDPKKRSEFRLSESEVVKRYVAKAKTDLEQRELLASVHWALEEPDDRQCQRGGCERAPTHQAEVNAPCRGHGYDYYCKEHGEEKRGSTYISAVREESDLFRESDEDEVEVKP